MTIRLRQVSEFWGAENCLSFVVFDCCEKVEVTQPMSYEDAEQWVLRSLCRLTGMGYKGCYRIDPVYTNYYEDGK
jgi:hypothetical protein